MNELPSSASDTFESMDFYDDFNSDDEEQNPEDFWEIPEASAFLD